MKILPNEVSPPLNLPTLEKVADATEKARSAIMEQGTEFIYDEAKFTAFIDYVATQNWLSPAEIETCKNDLQKDSPQELLNLWIKTESIATPAWWVSASFEVGSGELNVLRNYVLCSVIRSITSLCLSRGVVDHRYFTAAFEGIPHIGRVAPFIALAEEHPELTRMLWSYKACRKTFKKDELTQADDKLKQKFESSRNSNLLEFIIDPQEYFRGLGIKAYTQSEVLRRLQAAGLSAGLK